MRTRVSPVIPYMEMFGLPFRRFTGLLAMLLMATQSSAVLCVATLCLERVASTSEPQAAALEHHGRHPGGHESGGTEHRRAPFERSPLPSDCQVMALCTAAVFDSVVQIAESVASVARRAAPPAGFLLLSRVTAPETPPPRA